jgi:regulator of sigma D
LKGNTCGNNLAARILKTQLLDAVLLISPLCAPSQREVQRHLPRREEIAMLDSCQNAQERWGGVHSLIDRWLKAREELAQSFRALHDQKLAFADKDTNGDFCVLLVDYCSAWHFEVCEQLVREAKDFDDEKALKLAEEINPRINDITQFALAFNDHCAKGECKDTERFAEKLGKLGGLLHERFELEDCLIEVLHNAHKEEGAVQA